MKLFRRAGGLPADGERGAAALEMALVLGFLLMLAMGVFEYGMAFRSWQGVTAASREGARIGASAGSAASADCAILEASAAALLANTGAEVTSIEIYETDEGSGLQGDTNRYKPFDPATDDPSSLVCTSWSRQSNGWPPAARDGNGTTRDWIGVRVGYRHSWITGFLWWNGTVDWDDEAAMRIEPVTY